MNNTATKLFDSKTFVYLSITVLLLFLYREAVTIFSPITLFYDEAYYLGWAQSLEWGYYSKPPMVGWLIHLTTSLFGNAAWSVKLAAPVLYSLSALFIFKIAKALFDEKAALYAALIFILMPMVSFNSLFVTTDAPQVFFWTFAMFCFFKAIRSDCWGWWLAAGIVGGLGLLSKYTFIFLPAGFLLYGIWSAKGRELLTKPRFWTACFLALAIFSPNLYWNMQHDFISFQHTAEISHLSDSLFHPNKLVEFWLGQLAVFGPVFMVTLIVYAFKAKSATEAEKLLWCFFIPTFLGISAQALLAKANVNWAATAYVSASVLLGYYLARDNKRTLLVVGLVLNAMMAVGFYHYHTIADVLGVELKSKTDPYHRIMGWKELVEQAQPYFDAHPDLKLASDTRDILAYFGYYLSPQDFRGRMLNTDGHIANHYELKYPIDTATESEFLFVSKSMSQATLETYFTHVEPLAELEVSVYPKFTRKVFLYRVSQYKF